MISCLHHNSISRTLLPAFPPAIGGSKRPFRFELNGVTRGSSTQENFPKDLEVEVDDYLSSRKRKIVLAGLANRECEIGAAKVEFH